VNDETSIQTIKAFGLPIYDKTRALLLWTSSFSVAAHRKAPSRGNEVQYAPIFRLDAPAEPDAQ